MKLVSFIGTKLDQQAIRLLEELQRNVKLALEEFDQRRRPQMKSELLTEMSLTTGTNLVPHRLGRRVVGWQVVDIDAVATIYRDDTSTVEPTKFLPLVVSANCTVRLLVF